MNEERANRFSRSASRHDADARRLALEIIASLINVKKTAANQLLRPAGVTDAAIRRFLTERDPATGDRRSKRDAGTVLLDDLALAGEDGEVIRRLIEIASEWSSFHLAQDEYKARAVVQKAHDLRGILDDAAARERLEAEARRQAAEERRQREQIETLRRESALLLAQFEHAATSKVDPQQRGYFLEDLLNRLFDLHGIPILRAFKRNNGGEQIDAAFELEGWHYIVECRWRARLADIRQLDGLLGQVGRSGRQTMGLFLSIEGWSEHVVPLLKQNAEKAIFLMEGFDLRTVLDQQIDLRRLLKAKISALNLEAEPYLSVTTFLKSS